MIQSGYNERMPDFSGRHKTRDVCHWNQPSDQVLTMIKSHRMDTVAIIEHDCEAGVAHDCRVGENLPDNPGIRAFVTGFLAQFALAGYLRRSVGGIHHSAWDFELDCVRTVA